MKSRIFKIKPRYDLVIKALTCIGLKNLDDYETKFLIKDIETLNTIDKYKEIEEEIKSHYYKSISKMYFGDKYEIKTIITIIRHLLKIKNRNLKIIRKVNPDTKIKETFYKLVKIDPNKEDDDYTIKFD